MNHRWYDKYNELAQYMDHFKKAGPKISDKILVGMINLIRKTNPKILSDFILNFSLEINRRRWYDNDSYLWLIINGLEYADESLIQKVTEYLKENWGKIN